MYLTLCVTSIVDYDGLRVSLEVWEVWYLAPVGFVLQDIISVLGRMESGDRRPAFVPGRAANEF